MVTFNNPINNFVGSTNSGVTNTLTIQNQSNTASSQALENILVGGSSAGDAFTTYTITGVTNWSLGIDNSVSNDPYVIAASTALGTTNVVSMTTSGNVSCVLGDFDVTRSSSGGNVKATISNTSNTASSTAELIISSGGTSAGDPGILYEVTGGTTWFSGLRASDQLYFLNPGTSSNQNPQFSMNTVGAFTFQHSTSGATVAVLSTNLSNTASSDARVASEVAGTSAGDPYYLFDISGGGAFVQGLDNSDSDSYVICSGTAIGTNNTVHITSAGQVTFPLQPAFLAYLGTQDSNVTGDGTQYTLGSGNALTEIFDIGSNFNTNGTFTSPVTGQYQLNGSWYLLQTIATMTIDTVIVTSNNTFHQNDNNTTIVTNVGFVVTILCDMDAGDTATSRVGVGNGTKVVDIYGSAGDPRNSFSGFLAC